MDYFVRALSDELKRRVQKNPRYSLRAYATYLGLHPSALCRILSGKQPLSSKSGVRIIRKLSLDENEQRLFLQSMLEAKKRKSVQELSSALKREDLSPPKLEVSPQAVAPFTSLLCFSILQLTFLESFKSDPVWISDVLKTSAAKVQPAMNALINIGLLNKTEDRIVSEPSRTILKENGPFEEFSRKHQQLVLDRAIRSVQEDPSSERAHYEVTIAIDPSKLQEANKMMIEFADRVCDFLTAGTRTEVYQLAFQLFPVSRARSLSEGSV